MVEIVTTAPTKPKVPAHTYSRLKEFETCPRRYYELQVAKNWPAEESEHLRWGQEVHDAIAKSLKTGEELPAHMRGYKPWLDKVNNTPGVLLVEDQCKWSIDRDFKPCGYFSPFTWMRCQADAVKIDEEFPGAALAVDWKTGKSANVDPVQLVVIALAMFIHFPKILCIRAQFIFLQDDATTTVKINREEAPEKWAELLPRLKSLQQAAELGNFPPWPNKLCARFCPVKTCEHWGK